MAADKNKWYKCDRVCGNRAYVSGTNYEIRAVKVGFSEFWRICVFHIAGFYDGSRGLLAALKLRNPYALAVTAL